jgi:hypothetical protein
MKVTVEVMSGEFCSDETLLMEIDVTRAYPEGSYTTLHLTARATPDFLDGELMSVDVKAERLLAYEQDGELVPSPTMFCDVSTEQLIAQHRTVEAYVEKRYRDDYKAWMIERSV